MSKVAPLASGKGQQMEENGGREFFCHYFFFSTGSQLKSKMINEGSAKFSKRNNAGRKCELIVQKCKMNGNRGWVISTNAVGTFLFTNKYL